MSVSLRIVTSSTPIGLEKHIARGINGARPNREVIEVMENLGYNFGDGLAEGADCTAIIKEWWAGVLPSITAEPGYEEAFATLLPKVDFIHWG